MVGSGDGRGHCHSELHAIGMWNSWGLEEFNKNVFQCKHFTRILIKPGR